MRAVFILAMLPIMLNGPAAAQVYGGQVYGGQGYGGNDRLRQQVEDYRGTVRQGVGMGATIGAAVGLGVGALTGQRNPLIAGLIGTAVGSMIGAAGGSAVADEKRRQFQTESRLDDRIARLRTSNAKLASIVQVTDRLISQRRQELAGLRGEARDARARLRQAVAEDRQLVQTALDSAVRTRDDLSAEVRARGGQALSRSISKLDRQRQALGAIEGSL